jgi:hypothetical protein
MPFLPSPQERRKRHARTEFEPGKGVHEMHTVVIGYGSKLNKIFAARKTVVNETAYD